MKLLKIVGIGLAIWGITLLWPEINLLLTAPAMTILAVGVGAVILAYGLGQYFGQPDGNGNHGQPLPHYPTQATNAGRHTHSRPTLPLRPDKTKNLHSHP